jgi:hypothetical protein
MTPVGPLSCKADKLESTLESQNCHGGAKIGEQLAGRDLGGLKFLNIKR